MRRILAAVLLSLSAATVAAQPGPGLFGDRHWRGPVADSLSLPASGSLGDVRLVRDSGELVWWSGSTWEPVAGGGGADTSAGTICSGTTTYLDGEGLCDDLSLVYSPLGHGHLLSSLSGAVTDAQVPDTITIDLAGTASVAQAGDSATGFFPAGTVEAARLPALSDLSGAVTDSQVPDSITVDLSSVSAIALSGDSATGFFSDGTVEAARLPALSALSGSVTDSQVPDSITVSLAAAASTLAANGADCLSGSYSRGVDAAGSAEGCTVDDDVPEAADFGALALTGPVTSSGLATSIAADAVALGSQTTGGYAASISEGGPATTATALAADPTDCSAGQFATAISAAGNLTCAAVSAGDVVGPASSTDNAVARFDSTTGKLIQGSSVTIGDTGVVVLPDGTEGAPTLKFNSFGTTGLYADGATTLAFSVAGATRWRMSNSGLYSQNSGYFQNAGVGAPVFSPGSADLDSGLGANAANDMAMWAGNSIAERWLLVTSGLTRALTVGQSADTPQAVTCADSGNASASTATINATTGVVYVTNSDADGCAVTLGETNVTSGVRVEIVVVATAGGSVTFADTSGVTELAGAFSAGLYDSLDLRYISDRWVETGRSDN